MANVLVNDESLKAIGNSIRGKNGKSDLYTPAEMPAAIEAIESGGTPSALDSLAYYKAVRPKNWPSIALPDEMVMESQYGKQEFLFEVNVSTPENTEYSKKITLTTPSYPYMQSKNVKVSVSKYKDTQFISKQISYPDTHYGTHEFIIDARNLESDVNFLKVEVETMKSIGSKYNISNGNDLIPLEVSEKIVDQGMKLDFINSTANSQGPIYISGENSELNGFSKRLKVVPIAKNCVINKNFLYANSSFITGNFVGGPASSLSLTGQPALVKIPYDTNVETTMTLPTYGGQITKEYFLEWIRSLPKKTSKTTLKIPATKYAAYRFWLPQQDIVDLTNKGYTITT